MVLLMCIHTINRLMLQCSGWFGDVFLSSPICCTLCVISLLLFLVQLEKSLVTKPTVAALRLLRHESSFQKNPPKEFWSYLIAHGKLHRAKEKPQILPESPSSLPNLRLARYVNIADLSPYAQAPSFKNHYCSEISKINADLLIHYYLLYLYIYGNCWKWSSW